jgi:hypothetical protein
MRIAPLLLQIIGFLRAFTYKQRPTILSNLIFPHSPQSIAYWPI